MVHLKQIFKTDVSTQVICDGESLTTQLTIASGKSQNLLKTLCFSPSVIVSPLGICGCY